jgi:hypothetical protein
MPRLDLYILQQMSFFALDKLEINFNDAGSGAKNDSLKQSAEKQHLKDKWSS